jgi:hypothetical protein
MKTSTERERDRDDEVEIRETDLVVCGYCGEDKPVNVICECLLGCGG